MPLKVAVASSHSKFLARIGIYGWNNRMNMCYWSYMLRKYFSGYLKQHILVNFQECQHWCDYDKTAKMWSNCLMLSTTFDGINKTWKNGLWNCSIPEILHVVIQNNYTESKHYSHTVTLYLTTLCNKTTIVSVFATLYCSFYLPTKKWFVLTHRLFMYRNKSG